MLWKQSGISLGYKWTGAWSLSTSPDTLLNALVTVDLLIGDSEKPLRASRHAKPGVTGLHGFPWGTGTLGSKEAAQHMSPADEQ